MQSQVLLATALCGFALWGCESPPKKDDAAAAKPSATSRTKAKRDDANRKFSVMPDIVVDDLGPSIAGRRVELSQETGPGKLTQLAKRIPFESSEKLPVVRTVHRAKFKHVAALVDALAAAGAKSIKLKMTGGRKDMPSELLLTPASRLSEVRACSVVTMVLDDISTAVWPFGGGGGRKHTKGLAGPDLTRTVASIEKHVARCDSDAGFFSGTPEQRWETAFHVGGAIKLGDKKKKITTLVMLTRAPVAGRAVKLKQ
jgi:hypothetical protein